MARDHKLTYLSQDMGGFLRETLIIAKVMLLQDSTAKYPL